MDGRKRGDGRARVKKIRVSGDTKRGGGERKKWGTLTAEDVFEAVRPSALPYVGVALRQNGRIFAKPRRHGAPEVWVGLLRGVAVLALDAGPSVPVAAAPRRRPEDVSLGQLGPHAGVAAAADLVAQTAVILQPLGTDPLT